MIEVTPFRAFDCVLLIFCDCVPTRKIRDERALQQSERRERCEARIKKKEKAEEESNIKQHIVRVCVS